MEVTGGENLNSYHYANANASIDMFITYNAVKGSAYGHLTDGHTEATYVIEFCGDDIHVLKTLDVQMLMRDSKKEKVYYGKVPTTLATEPGIEEDTTTIATYTVKMYYT